MRVLKQRQPRAALEPPSLEGFRSRVGGVLGDMAQRQAGSAGLLVGLHDLKGLFQPQGRAGSPTAACPAGMQRARAAPQKAASWGVQAHPRGTPPPSPPAAGGVPWGSVAGGRGAVAGSAVREDLLPSRGTAGGWLPGWRCQRRSPPLAPHSLNLRGASRLRKTNLGAQTCHILDCQHLVIS